MKKELKLLIAIFLLAIGLRMLFFPNNIYFGFDQARDAFASLAVAHGDLRIIGPPTAYEGIYHGPLYYYLFAPIYLFAHGNPEWVSLILRTINASGIFLVFMIGTILFNKKVGLISALIFAFSFEQTQYALFLNHPSLAVISVLLFYLGLVILIFNKKYYGLVISLLGLGLSIQLEFPLIYLTIVFVLIIFVYRMYLPKLSKKIMTIGFMTFILAISTFIIAEFKFNFRTLKSLVILLTQKNFDGVIPDRLNNLLFISRRFIEDNLIRNKQISGLILITIVLIFCFLYLRYKHNLRQRLLFLAIWFGAGLIIYINNTSSLPLYYYGVGVSVSLVIFIALVLEKLIEKVPILGYLLLFLIFYSNIITIIKVNPAGSIPEINVQSGMLLSDEVKSLDYIYNQAQGQAFCVNALSMPLNVNTTWSYLFEWYGQNKYHYLPVWGGDAAAGFPGNLKVEKAKSNLPPLRFLILEPTRGIENYLISDFIENENIFSKIMSEEYIGKFKIQQRQPI